MPLPQNNQGDVRLVFIKDGKLMYEEYGNKQVLDLGQCSVNVHSRGEYSLSFLLEEIFRMTSVGEIVTLRNSVFTLQAQLADVSKLLKSYRKGDVSLHEFLRETATKI